MEACDRLSLTSIEPRDVLASASEEDGLLDILQRHLLLEPLYGQLAIRGRVPTTDTGPAQQHLLEGLNEQSLSRSIRIQSVRLGRPLIRPVVASDLKGPSGMLVGAHEQQIQRELARDLRGKQTYLRRAYGLSDKNLDRVKELLQDFISAATVLAMTYPDLGQMLGTWLDPVLTDSIQLFEGHSFQQSLKEAHDWLIEFDAANISGPSHFYAARRLVQQAAHTTLLTKQIETLTESEREDAIKEHLIKGMTLLSDPSRSWIPFNQYSDDLNALYKQSQDDALKFEVQQSLSVTKVYPPPRHQGNSPGASPRYIPHLIISDLTEAKAILLRTEGGWMARRKLSMNEYLEMVYQWHRGRSVRRIRDSLKMSRKTIHKYLRRLAEEGLSRERPLPGEAQLAQMVASVVKSAVFEQPARERIRPYHPQIVDWLNQPDMTLRQVQRLLEENHHVGVSYMSVYRYVRTHIQPLERPVTVRLHPPAGEQAQVDFGYAGLMRDPQSGNLRRAWAFILILSHSRHRFVRFVFRQDNRTWLDCHIRALKFFGGCPTLIVLDNLKNGVLRPDLYDPTLNPAYAELERHYGFVADPAKVAMARHKGKVERCVPVVRQQILAGREFRDIDEANRRALHWCLVGGHAENILAKLDPPRGDALFSLLPPGQVKSSDAEPHSVRRQCHTDHRPADRSGA